jgi:hypothetical protein
MVVSSTIAIILLALHMGLVWWIVWRFLIGPDESDEDFEALLKKPIMCLEAKDSNWSQLYSVSVSESLTCTTVFNRYVTQACEEQRSIAQHQPPG